MEHGDTDGAVSMLSDEAWLTMPPEPYAYQVAPGPRLRWCEEIEL